MTTLLPAYKISPPVWMCDSDLAHLLDTLNKDGINARLVGGCLRNYFFNKDIYDIDIACKLKPEQVIEICANAQIKTIPTGIAHGTITAHINGHNFEITTLRKDTNTDGRHADVTYTDDWTEDAKRRDFTINALYADRDGNIYDPLGTGLDDLHNKHVRFIGDAEKRIEEDYLRILRFFRFYADYNEGAADQKSLAACIKLKHGIDTLSDERICDELFKTLKSPNADRAIRLMSEGGFFNLKPRHAQQLKHLIDLQTRLENIDIIARYSITEIDDKFIKNKKIKGFINNLNKFQKHKNMTLKQSLFLYERDVVVQGLLLKNARGETVNDHDILLAMSLPRPIFPLSAQDVIQHHHLQEGPELGIKLKQAQEIWLASDCTIKREELLERI